MRIKVSFDRGARSSVNAALAAAGLPSPTHETAPSGDTLLVFPASVDEVTVRAAVKQGLTSWRLRGVAGFDPTGLKDLTPQQLDAYIKSNITDLASAKTYIKKLSRLVLYLYKRELGEV